MSNRIEKITTKLATLNERIAKDQADVLELQAELSALEALANIKEGDVVYFATGRGETRAVIGGRVLAVAETEKGKQLRVFAGEGINASCYTLTSGQVLLVDDEPVAPAATEEAQPEA